MGDTQTETLWSHTERGGGKNRWSTEDFYGGETARYGTTVMYMCPYAFVQTRRESNTQSEL